MKVLKLNNLSLYGYTNFVYRGIHPGFTMFGLLWILVQGIRKMALKSTEWSCRKPGFNYQHPHGGLQSSVAPVPGPLISSSGFQWYCIHIVHRHICRKNTHTDNMNIAAVNIYGLNFIIIFSLALSLLFLSSIPSASFLLPVLDFWEVESVVSQILDKHSITELYPQPYGYVFSSIGNRITWLYA